MLIVSNDRKCIERASWKCTEDRDQKAERERERAGVLEWMNERINAWMTERELDTSSYAITPMILYCLKASHEQQSTHIHSTPQTPPSPSREKEPEKKNRCQRIFQLPKSLWNSSVHQFVWLRLRYPLNEGKFQDFFSQSLSIYWYTYT